MQFLSVERRRLTIALMYGIITAEKEFMRSRILDFLIASISHRNELDHIFDHLRIRTTRKQCLQEHPKASFSYTKAPKSLVNQAKNRLFSVWDVDAAGSNPVTPTKNQPKTSYFDLFSAVFLYIFHKIGCFQLTTCLPDFGAFYWIFHGFLSILLKIPFLCLLRLKN